VNPSVLRCTVLRRYPVALVEVTGMLRLDTAPVLRAAALKLLADRPTALVLDVAGLVVADPTAAAVLPLVEHHAGVWADAALLLAAPSVSVREALRRTASDLRVHDTRAAALTAAAARPVPARLRLSFSADPTAPGEARQAVRRAGAGWGLPVGLTERVAQVASELVTNVVEHAGTPGVLTVSRRSHVLHIAVRDGSRAPPLMRPPSDALGYGLALIDALSSGWGTRTVPDGKVVWATLRVWPARANGPRPRPVRREPRAGSATGRR
jgi:anti-sigma regulatory factor (Ser/Thr protein kinase)/anti-anti-sigma regulatory factor